MNVKEECEPQWEVGDCYTNGFVEKGERERESDVRAVATIEVK